MAVMDTFPQPSEDANTRHNVITDLWETLSQKHTSTLGLISNSQK